MIAMVTDWGKESGFKEPLQGRRKGGLKKQPVPTTEKCVVIFPVSCSLPETTIPELAVGGEGEGV